MINNSYSEFIYKRTYSRWEKEKNRREDWSETIDRYFDFFTNNVVPEKLHRSYLKAKKFVESKSVMPSMRAMWSAGEALKKGHIAAYNCAYVTVDSIKSFSETLYILMHGTGIGFSVERQYVIKLPDLPDNIKPIKRTIIFEDSKEGWAEGFNDFINCLYQGEVPNYDLSKIRPEGSLLKTFGGRASGPAPLEKLLKFTTKIFEEAINKGLKKLSTIDCYDIMCNIADCVVVGGVRRSALLSLSNFSDSKMRIAKEGNFWETHPYRSYANNSVAFTEKPQMSLFLEEWMSLMKSGTGERGIFNRESATNIVEKIGRRKTVWNMVDVDSREIKEVINEWGCNPCSEIILRPYEFCNLTEVVIRSIDTLDDITEKIKYATILGIVQSMLTDFKYINENWKNNCEEERLLGVSLTGIMDHPVLANESNQERLNDWLTTMKNTAIKVAKKWSKDLGINMPVAITSLKPSGSVSQLCDSASGIHPRYAKHYIRRVRVNKTDPIAKYLIDKGVKWNPEVGQTLDNHNTVVFEFPIRSPKKAICRNDKTALQQLEHWKIFQENWCEHKPSITVYVRDHEWLEVGSWVYKNWDYVSGISFLPYDTGLYQLAPYEEITEEIYNDLVKEFPKFDFTDLFQYEIEDNTEGSKEYACVGGACEIV